MKNILLVLMLMFLIGCTENQHARYLGGTSNVKLECGQKLLNITWKEQALWYITRPMHNDEIAETYEFIENSSLGMLEGKVKIVECQ